jgi:peptidoglycan/LPS O-acetylase OafA/YrhL
MRESARNPNLDVVRAAALGLVVIGHMIVMSPVRHPLALGFAWEGGFGVDLFFVLSGWLIGGLFWQERNRTGHVAWGHFFLRRALRTVPPYLVVMPFAWFAAHQFAPEHPSFDLRFLVFLQNCAEKIPFYSISWSLCVEEHFYLFLPGIVLLALGWRLPLNALFFGLLALSPICRAVFESTRTVDVFDRSVLGTHLRLDGLILGFWTAYLAANHPPIWERLAPWFPRFLGPALILFVLTPWLPSRGFYVFGFTLLGLIFLVAIGTAAVTAPWNFPGLTAVRRLAGMSYSVYLTHSLVLHVARTVAFRAGAWSESVYWLLVGPLVLLVGYSFFRLVERPCMTVRDQLLPGRVASAPLPA